MKSHREMFEALLKGETLYYANNDIECYINEEGELVDYYRIDYLKTPNLWEIKPKTININGFEVPETVKTTLEDGTIYYTPALFDDCLYRRWAWNDDNSDKQALERNIIHLTPEAAIIHAKALLSLMGVTND